MAPEATDSFADNPDDSSTEKVQHPTAMVIPPSNADQMRLRHGDRHLQIAASETVKPSQPIIDDAIPLGKPTPDSDAETASKQKRPATTISRVQEIPTEPVDKAAKPSKSAPKSKLGSVVRTSIPPANGVFGANIGSSANGLASPAPGGASPGSRLLGSPRPVAIQSAHMAQMAQEDARNSLTAALHANSASVVPSKSPLGQQSVPQALQARINQTSGAVLATNGEDARYRGIHFIYPHLSLLAGITAFTVHLFLTHTHFCARSS